jgi:hypothetical protein
LELIFESKRSIYPDRLGTNEEKAEKNQFSAAIMSSVEAPVRKTAVLSHSYINAILLPRQARDKHRESSKKSGVFLRPSSF